ncbi:MAG: substrate-binding domain-containing protein [Simplicispira sp.]|nr:substrate-binding domain-containing protein [Simplicispira sp.]
MLNRFWQIFLAVGLLLGLLACKDASELRLNSVSTAAAPAAPSKPAPASEKKTIALVMKTLTNPFFTAMEQGARRAESQLGVQLLVKVAAQETSIEQQIQIVDDLVSAKVDAIVIAPGDSQRLVPALKRAADAGIQLVNLDNRLDPDAVQQAGLAPIPFLSVDNEKAAYTAAQWLAKDARPGTQAVVLEGIRSADNARQRHQGATRALTDNPAVQLVASESAHWKIDEGYSVTRSLLTHHPQVQLIYAANDMMALGALQYLQEQGRTDVKVGGYDAIDDALAEVRKGRLSVTVDQQAAEQGLQGILLAHRLLAGEKVPLFTLVDVKLVTPATLR